MKFLAIIFMLLSMAGCATPHTNRLNLLNERIDAAGVLLKEAQEAGNTEQVMTISEEMDALRKEREKVSEMAREETNNRQVLLLTILGIVTGGLKLAADKFGKAMA